MATDTANGTAAARIISADCHVNEPPHVFDGVPAQVPRPRARRCGAPPTAATAGASTAGRPSAASASRPPPGASRPTRSCRGCTFDEILPGNYDGTAHVARHAEGRRRRLDRLPEQRDLHLHRARPRARARVHALLQRLGARRVPGRGARPHRRRSRCCRSTTASTCASPSSTAASRRARVRASSPASRSSRTTIAVLRPALRARRRSGDPAHVPSHVRRQAVGGRLRRAGRAEDLDRRHRVPLLRRGAAVHVHGDRATCSTVIPTCASSRPR